MAQSEYGTRTITQLSLDALHKLINPPGQEACSQSVLSSLTKSSSVDGLMEELELTESITVNCSGKLKMLTREESPPFASLQTQGLLSLVACLARSEFGKSDLGNSSHTSRSIHKELLKSNCSQTTSTCWHVLETSQSFAGTWRQKKECQPSSSAWVESMVSQ